MLSRLQALKATGRAVSAAVRHSPTFFKVAAQTHLRERLVRPPASGSATDESARASCTPSVNKCGCTPRPAYDSVKRKLGAEGAAFGLGDGLTYLLQAVSKLIACCGEALELAPGSDIANGVAKEDIGGLQLEGGLTVGVTDGEYLLKWLHMNSPQT
eukprot:1799712-Pleurochrysis_carterae.AAC.3